MDARSWLRILTFLLVALTFASGYPPPKARSHRTPEYTYKVIRRFPHDANAFTQGLAYRDGYFYEGTGLNGRSSLRQVRIESGEVIRKVDLARQYFGEGITPLGDQIFQLTWQSHLGFVYRLSDFHWIKSFSYTGEGWGLTTDGHDLYMSDGTPDIRVLDPSTFAVKRSIHVHDGSKAIEQLNELEWVEGEIYANIWQTDRIARISPQTGAVVGWIDLAGLLPSEERQNNGAVLNGIAYDRAGKRLFVTGKLWPAVFQIELVPKAAK
jgi:glutamine cyclotransferase